MFSNTIIGPRRSGKSTILAKLVADAAMEDNQKILIITLNHQTGQYLREKIMQQLDILNIDYKPAAEGYGIINTDTGSRLFFISNHFIYNYAMPTIIAVDQFDYMTEVDKTNMYSLITKDTRVWMTETEK